MIKSAIYIAAIGLMAMPANADSANDDISLAALQAGERVEISYDSQGCFSPNQAELSFTRGGVEVSELNGRASIPDVDDLSFEKLSKIDTYLQLLRRGELGGECSTIETYSVRIWKDGQLVNSYSAIDGSCAAEQNAELYSPGVLVSEIETAAARAARAKMMGR